MKQIAAVVNQKRRAASARPIQHVLLLPHCNDCMHTLRFILLPLSDCYCASNAHNRKELLPHQYLKVSRDAVVNKDSNDTPCVTASSRPSCASPLHRCPKLQARFDRLFALSEFSRLGLRSRRYTRLEIERMYLQLCTAPTTATESSF